MPAGLEDGAGPGQPPPAAGQAEPFGFCLEKKSEVVFFRRLRLRIGFPTAAGADRVALSHVT